MDSIIFSHMTPSADPAVPYPPITGANTVNVIALAIDPVNKTLYYSDIQRNAISRSNYQGQSEDVILG